MNESRLPVQKKKRGLHSDEEKAQTHKSKKKSTLFSQMAVEENEWKSSLKMFLLTWFVIVNILQKGKNLIYSQSILVKKVLQRFPSCITQSIHRGLIYEWRSLVQSSLLKLVNKGIWVAQSVECPTLAPVMISWFVGLSPASGSLLTAQSLEPASDSVSPSLSAPPLLILYLYLSLSKNT